MIALHTRPTSSYPASSHPSTLFNRVREAIAHPPFVQRPIALITQLLQPSQPAIVCLEHLQELPDDTFGYQWAMALNHQPFSQPYRSRRQQLYAGVYLLTGYSVDPMGAAEVHAFLLGTKGNIIELIRCLTLMVTVYKQRLTMAHSSLTLKNVKQRLYEAYQRGQKSCFDLDTWQPEFLWDLSPAYVRRWFGITD